MGGVYEAQYAHVKLPRETVSDTFPATGVNTGGLDLSAYLDKFVSITSTQKCGIRAGSSSSVAATAGDYPLKSDVDYSFKVESDSVYVSVYGLGSAGTIYVAPTSD